MGNAAGVSADNSGRLTSPGSRRRRFGIYLFGFVAVGLATEVKIVSMRGRRAGVVYSAAANPATFVRGVRAGDVDDFAAVFTGHAADLGGAVLSERRRRSPPPRRCRRRCRQRVFILRV